MTHARSHPPPTLPLGLLPLGPGSNSAAGSSLDYDVSMAMPSLMMHSDPIIMGGRVVEHNMRYPLHPLCSPIPTTPGPYTPSSMASSSSQPISTASPLSSISSQSPTMLPYLPPLSSKPSPILSTGLQPETSKGFHFDESPAIEIQFHARTEHFTLPLEGVNTYEDFENVLPGTTPHFVPFEDSGLNLDDYVVVQGDRGEDLGRIIGFHHNFFKNMRHKDFRCVLRKATASEIENLLAKKIDDLHALDICLCKIWQHKLPMTVLDAEYQYDRKKLIFYFVAQSRIDFRDLLRDLFKTFKTRIWLKQLGPR